MLKLISISLLLFLFACGQNSPEPREDNSEQATNTKTQPNQKATKLSDNLDKANAFLAENAKKEGITVTASGLQYEVLVSGDGKTPGPTDTVVTHYAGSFLDGSEFDSSVARGEPISFPVNGVIGGWTEALQLMQEGDKWKLYIPPTLAYGEKGVGPIPGNSALIFEVELISIK